MRNIVQLLLFSELCFCFAPIIILWIMSIFASLPMLMGELFHAKNPNYLGIFAILLGAFGVVGIYSSAKVVVFDSGKNQSFLKILVLNLLGYIALSILSENSLELRNIILVLLPLMCSIHFLVIAYLKLKPLRS